MIVGGESVCCVTAEACRCCRPLGSGESLDGEFWMGLESGFKDRDGEMIVGVEERDAALGRGGDWTTSS